MFDEAHNIDSVCIEALSVNIKQDTIRKAEANLKNLAKIVRESKELKASRLKSEYEKLVHGLASAGVGQTDQLLANPVLPQDLLHEAVPGNIRKAEHFLTFLKRLLEFLKKYMNVCNINIS